MADIANLINYEQTYAVPLIGGGKEIGITFNIVSFDSDRVVKATRAVEAKKWQAVFESEDKKADPERLAELSEESRRERLVACIDSWDFGGHSFGDLPADPECNDANKRYVINHPNALWIRQQIEAKGADIGNFTNLSELPSRKKSKS